MWLWGAGRGARARCGHIDSADSNLQLEALSGPGGVAGTPKSISQVHQGLTSIRGAISPRRVCESWARPLSRGGEVGMMALSLKYVRGEMSILSDVPFM